MDLADKIFAEIQSKGLRPISPWRLKANAFGFKVAFLFVGLLGSLSIGFGLESLFPDSHAMQGKGFKQMAIGWLPVLWASFAFLTGLLAWRIYRQFQFGYRSNAIRIVSIFVLGTLALGLVWYKSNGVFLIHRYLMSNLQPYQNLFENHRRQQWSQPSQGRLSGEVVYFSENHFILRDWSKNYWFIPFFQVGNNPTLKSIKIRIKGNLCGWPPAINSSEIRNKWKLMPQAFCPEKVMTWIPGNEIYGSRGKAKGGLAK
jgi:hypothetical protein